MKMSEKRNRDITQCHLDSGIGLMKEGLTAKQTGGWFFFCSPNLKNEHSKQAGDIIC